MLQVITFRPQSADPFWVLHHHQVAEGEATSSLNQVMGRQTIEDEDQMQQLIAQPPDCIMQVSLSCLMITRGPERVSIGDLTDQVSKYWDL